MSEWMDEKDLRLNVVKTKAMVVLRKKSPPTLNIRLGESEIECDSSYRYLGIIIASNLSWSLHIDSVYSKAKRLLGMLYRQF